MFIFTQKSSENDYDEDMGVDNRWIVMTPKHITFHRLNNGIQEVIFHDASRLAADAFFEVFDHYLEHANPDDISRPLLVDCSKSGMPPLRHMYQKGQPYLQKYPVRKQSRTAIIHPINTVGQLAFSFFQLLNRNMHLFKPEDRDEAIAWLIESFADATTD